jgi:predicted transcriptional regulator
MTLLTQFLVTKGSQSMHIAPADLSTYRADGWTVENIRYSEGGEGLDTTSLVLMVKEPDRIFVRPGEVATYLSAGYTVAQVDYLSTGLVLNDTGGNLVFLDTPAFSSAEIGTVDAVTLVVNFTTEVASADFAAGVTIKVDDAAQEIASATRQTDHTVVHYVIPTVANGSTVTWAYDDLTGGIASANDGTILDAITAQAVTNNVPE